ncbi:hypothetical protein [Amycolatopsis magusensis]|uniref:Uncharacterized protein n=1 Tax=Amycolatopsis magusensis TaxID=882444 RepID=A0ABS4PXR6_9PSEU|nr:hypothetical protein [Amycolatopsis magusensis]MBP2183624.1 hypothetical protein [Amycolatopsis magusensis]
MRPVVDEAHGMADSGADILFPGTAAEIEARNRLDAGGGAVLSSAC